MNNTNQPYAGGQPQPYQNSYVPTPIEPPRNRGKAIVVVAIVLVFVALVAASIALLAWHPWSSTFLSGWKPPAAPQLTTEQIAELEKKYGYDITYRPNVSPTEEFSFSTNYDYSACRDNTCADAVNVYSTADLKKKVSSYVSSISSNKITVKPPTYNKAIDQSNIGVDGRVDFTAEQNTLSGSSGLAIAGENRLGIAEMYYLVQRLDEKGEKLSRPKVTIFSIKSDSKMLQAPNLTASVDSNGAVKFAWSPVQNAKEYYVVKISRSKTDSYNATYTVISRTRNTTINTAEYNGDKSRAEKALSAQGSITESSTYSQNAQLTYYGIKSEDSYYSSENGTSSLPSGKYVPVDHGVVSTSFAVIATADDAYSAAREIDGNALLAQVPLSLAGNQRSYMLSQNKSSIPYDYDRLPTFQPVTMADGRTAKKAVLFDEAKASVTSLPTADELALHYVVQGTYITGFETVYGTKGSFTTSYIQAKVAELNKRNLAALPQSGTTDLAYEVKMNEDNLKLDSRNNQQDKKTTERQQNSQLINTTKTKTIPNVDYPVNGSTKLVRYIAANIMAGNYTMDVKSYYTDPTVDIWDATMEAIEQNPYVGVNSGYLKSYYLNDTILSLYYSGITKSEMKKRQQDLFTKAKLVASTVTTPTMSDRDKALAINKWLVENATYDYDALATIREVNLSGDASKYYTNFPYAWNGLGTAVYVKGVCASYADAFKAISDSAGLKTITVTGTVTATGTQHAWNKSFIDGKWQVIDVTWNDSNDGTYTKYFGITDAAAARVEDETFMVDRFITDYAAN